MLRLCIRVLVEEIDVLDWTSFYYLISINTSGWITLNLTLRLAFNTVTNSFTRCCPGALFCRAATSSYLSTGSYIFFKPTRMHSAHRELLDFTNQYDGFKFWNLEPSKNPLKPSGHYMYRTVVTICTTRCNIHQFYVLPTHCIYECYTLLYI